MNLRAEARRFRIRAAIVLALIAVPTADAMGAATRTGGAAWSYLYNALDAIAQEKLVIDARTYQLDYTYNANGDLASRTNGHSGVAFDFDPDAFGRPRKAAVGAANYIAGVSYHPNGLIAGASYLNGQALSQSLDARQKPRELKTAKAGGATALWLTYAYEVRGKVSSVLDADGAAPDEGRTYTYDANGRLLTASGPWGAGSYTYDALGNLRGWTQGATTAAIAYDAAKNRVSSYAAGATQRAYAYDARGNVASNGATGFAYDFANQPVSLTGTGAASYAYDANLKRVKSVAGGKTVYTVYSRVTGGLIFRDEPTAGKKTDYVSAGGASVRIVKSGSTYTPEYSHADALGSPVAATDAAGAVLWRESYAPFGEARLKPAANADNTGFTGHLADKATGLVYMQARYYDPLLGRFYSTDPVGYEDQLNLYAYVANDPVNNTDPTGEFCPQCVTGLIGGIVGAAVGGVTTALTNPDATIGDIAVGAGKGFVSGAVIGATGNVAAGAAVAAALGGVTGGIEAAGKEGANAGTVTAAVIGGAVVDGASTLAGGAAGKFVGGAAGQVAGAFAGVAAGVGTQTAVNNLTPAAEAVSSAIADAANAAPAAFSEGVQQLTNPQNSGVPDFCSSDPGECK